MTREVTRTITDAEMDYCWKWYPEILFKGNKAMKADGMIDGVAMISPAWYDILYNHVAGTPGTDNVFAIITMTCSLTRICSITIRSVLLLLVQPARRRVL